MRILLRNYHEMSYIWKTAKYNMGNFWVDGEQVQQVNIVSIINDNRKNYIECSCCGQIFRRNDSKFAIHKANAIKPSTCFNCPNLAIIDCNSEKRVLSMNKYGEFIEKIERNVSPVCNKSVNWWTPHRSILSQEAICDCKKRQCADAMELDIVDFFTEYPGAFNDIATIDSLFDMGYDVFLPHNLQTFDIEFGYGWTLGVCVTKFGMIDKFYVWFEGDKYWLCYSKKYNELFHVGNDGKYELWNAFDLSPEERDKIKACIAKLYD